MGLHYDLGRFEGKDVAILQEIFRANNPPGEDVLDALVDVLGFDDGHMQTGAAFLLRHYLDAGVELGPERTGRLAGALADVPDGFARVHLCHAVDYLRIPAEHAASFADFFRSSLATKNTFLRAWAIHGFYRLAQQHVAYMQEAQALVAKALTDPAASVQARARKTLADE